MASRLNTRLDRLEQRHAPASDAKIDRVLYLMNSLGATDPEAVNELLASAGLTYRYPTNHTTDREV